MPNKDIKTEPRFMTMIQKDLQPVCKALNLDVDPFANARTVFIDRDSVGRILSYMSDHEINPEWYGLLDRKSTRLNSSHPPESRMPSSA